MATYAEHYDRQRHGKGHLGVSFLRGSMCAEGLGYGGLGGYFGEQEPFCVALFGLDVRKWTPWGIPEDHG